MTSCVRLNCLTTRLAVLVVCAAAGAAQAAEQAYPTRAIRLIVPFPPGGGSDAVARVLAPKLSEAMGQTWVVDNRTGAAGNLGAEIAVRSNPDGYTVFQPLSLPITANPSLYKLPFDVQRDLQPITTLAISEQILVIHPAVPARTLKEFVALTKQKPGALNYSSAGAGSAPHLGAELLKRRTGIDLTHVAYKGGGPATAAVLSGEVQAQVASGASALPFIKSGRLRALASTSARRSKLLADLPTVAESGYPGFEMTVWHGMAVPAGTPASIVQRIHGEVIKALQQPDVQTALGRQGLDPETSTPQEMAARIKAETAMWASVIKDAGIRAE